MNDPVTPATGIILAGGKSRRMGRDKALIEFEGKPLIAHVIDRLGAVCEEIIIVSNELDAYSGFGKQVIPDLYPGKGSLGGIYSGLVVARQHNIVAVACDMPFLNSELIRFQLSLAPQFDVVVPQARGLSSRAERPEGKRKTSFAELEMAKYSDLHPMHAVYSKSCLPAMETQLAADDLRIIKFYDLVNVRVVMPEEVDRYDPRHLSFFNMNTPEDLTLALSLKEGLVNSSDTQ